MGCKRASQMMEGVDMIKIFIQVLNKYIYLILNKCDDFDFEKVSQLIELIKDKIKEQQSSLNIGDDDNNNDLNKLQEIKQFFRLSCQYVNDLKNPNDDEIKQSFGKIEL